MHVLNNGQGYIIRRYLGLRILLKRGRPVCLYLFRFAQNGISMKKENGNQQEAIEFEIETMEAEILGLRGKYREEAMAAYRKLLVASTDKPVYFERY